MKSYGQNLKTGIPLWLLFLGVVFLLLLNMGILLKKMNTVFGWFFIVLYGAVILIAIMAASYAFPALSRFEMPTGWFVKLSLYLTFRHMGISLLLLLIFAASYLLLLWQPLLAAPIFHEDGTVEYYLPEGKWVNLLTGQVLDGNRWHRGCFDYHSLPLMVAPNTILPLGSCQDKPDYDYAGGVELCLSCFEESASTEIHTII